MRRPRMRRRGYYLDAATEARLRDRAKAHGLSQSAYLRALINGHRPGAEPGSDAAAADAWWDTRTPKRRVSIFRNHATPKDEPTVPSDQLDIFQEGV